MFCVVSINALPQVRQFAEDLETGVDFVARQILQALRAESLHREGSHHSAIKQSALQDFAIDLALGRDVTHEASSKGIAGSGGVFDLVDGKRGSAKGMRPDAKSTFAEEDSSTILAMLNDQGARPHDKNFSGGAQKIFFPGEHFGFCIVDQKHVDEFQRLRQLSGRALNPEIHGIASSEADVVHLQSHGRLQRGMDVSQEKKFRVGVFLWNAWLKFLENIQFREVGFRLVEI